MTKLKSLSAFSRDERGSMTLEFVLWIPLLLSWVVFSLAAFKAMENRGDAAKATYTISDIISRQKTVDRIFMNDLGILAEQVLPDSATGTKMRVSLIQRVDDTSLEVMWTECFGDILPLTDGTIPFHLMPDTMAILDTVVLTETYVPYFRIAVPYPLSLVFTQEQFTWTNAIVTRPRFGANIANPGNDLQNCSNPSN